MTHQWDQPPPPNPSLRGDPVTADLNRYLAEQDRADARLFEVEKMAGELLADSDNYDELLERLGSSAAGRIAVFRLYQQETPDVLKLREALREAAHAYADENLEKLLEGEDLAERRGL